MHLLRLFLVFVATIVVFASPLAPADAEYLRLRQASIGPGQEDFPAYLDGDVGVYQHGESADGAFTTSNHLTLDITSAAAVNLGSTTTLIAQTEDEDDIPDDQFLRFKNTRCGGEDSVCCMGDRAYFSSGVGTAAWPCSMKRHVRGAGNENVGWFFDSRWANYCHAPKYFSTCEEVKLNQGYHECYSDCT